MSGIVIRVPGVFTAPDLPKYEIDPRMSAGSLMLLDLTHSAGEVDGVPVNGAEIPNIAWDKANALVAGAPGQQALSAIFRTNDTFPSASFPLVERTPKKGLHVIKSQANDVNGKYVTFDYPDAVRTYLLANKTHAFYLSAIHRFTRAFTQGNLSAMAFAGNSTTVNMFGLGPAGTYPAGGLNATKILGNFIGNPTGGMAVGLSMMEVAVTGPTGSVTAIGSNAYIFGGGGNGGPWSGLHIGASQIFYSLLIEDLTVSSAALGMTVAQRASTLAAIELANYNAMIAAGGKLDGDTWTSPSGYP